MSSVTSEFAQVARRVGYFITLAADISGYSFAAPTDANAWPAPTVATVANFGVTGLNTVLEDMGEIAKYNGQIYRKVRVVTQTNAGGARPAFWILVPGGEYPVQGYPTPGTASGLNTVSLVARLG